MEEELLASKNLKPFAGSYSHEYARFKIPIDSGVPQYDGRIFSVAELAEMLRPARYHAAQGNATQKSMAQGHTVQDDLVEDDSAQNNPAQDGSAQDDSVQDTSSRDGTVPG